MRDIRASFVKAMEFRSRENFEVPVGLRELVRMPTFSGFVEAVIGTNPAFNMFICEMDDLVAARLFWIRVFEPMSSLLWCELCKSTDHAFDIGAHSGYYTLLGKRVNPSLAILSFEPHPTVFSRLMINIRANGLRSEYCLNKAIVPDDTQFVPLFVNADNWAITSGSSIVNPTSESINVGALNIKKIAQVKGREPTLLKMDVEGAEESLIGALAAISFAKIEDMLVEQLKPWSEFTNTALTEAGWSTYYIDEDKMIIVPSFSQQREGPPTESRNLWLTRRSLEASSQILDRLR
ncbi:MAG: FkbM family methyltransferase [Rhodospirillaceae bacterium]|nr:FkbM family methyltransferase [Rhodospirillaceae bacterium]